MRYSMLVYITKMGRTLLEAVQYLKTAPEGGLRVELLDNGRQMLAQIRAVLEQHRGDLHSETPLDRLSEIEDGWPAQGEGLEGQLEQFMRELSGQVSYQVRAVFFAELGEKWDSMESVYEYMRDDPRFDPVVVRTPVGRVVERDGKREQEIIYKDFLTPMGIPSLDYDRYSLEEDCPELAFISQPYESCTPPQFWPENIAKHTRLVYLPYYLPDILHEGSTSALCLLPVYRYAWRVVCFSEKHMVFYCKHSANHGGNALLTGLPKTDHLAELRKRGVPRPDGWEDMRGKTVFLWNSWYDMNRSSLQYASALTGWFETHEECFLLWRPHPMTDTVTKLYYPDRYQAYQLTRERIQAMPNAVIDTETSIDAAFFYSDALISDYSSLLPQYLPLDKPALWIRDRNWKLTGTELISSEWMEKTENLDGVYNFLNRIQKGEDRKTGLRRQIQERDLALADGQSGQRVCEAVWTLIHTEDQLSFWYSYGEEK